MKSVDFSEVLKVKLKSNIELAMLLDWRQEAQSHCDIFRERRKNIEKTHTRSLSKKPIIGKKILTETLSVDFKQVASENYEVEGRRNMKCKWTPSLFQIIKIPNFGAQSEIVLSKKHFKNFTVKSDLDERIQICGFREARVGISRPLKMYGIFTTFVESRIQFRRWEIASW